MPMLTNKKTRPVNGIKPTAFPSSIPTASNISSENIRNEVLDGRFVSPFLTEIGAQVLVLDPDKGTPFIQSLFYDE